jgi:hypothetical protein
MKARFPRVCECCKAPITTGERFVMLHGRAWKTSHALSYQSRRRMIHGKK